MRKFIENLHLPGNEQKFLEYQQKKRENMKKYALKRKENPTEDQKFRKRKAESNRKNFIGKKVRLDTSSDSDSFTTASALGKAVKKVENQLPTDITKGKEVVKILAAKFNVNSNESPKKFSLQQKIFAETFEKVKEFYENDDISYQCPGRKDLVKVDGENGKKIKVPKRYMRDTLVKSHQDFMENFPIDRFRSQSLHHCVQNMFFHSQKCLTIFVCAFIVKIKSSFLNH
jgi:hypothetical protein